MNKWEYPLDIKQHLTNDESWDGMVKAANGIAKELRTLPDTIFQGEGLYEDRVTFLEGVSLSDEGVYMDEQELLEEVNFALDVIYDTCDVWNVWLG
jgi:hypothetical protein